MRNSFSSSGAAQLARDLDAVWNVMDKYLGQGHGAIGMRKLKEALILLTLPVSGSESTDDEDQETMGLWEVEHKIFKSNESGREVLEGLGLEVLSEADARNVLERRIELGH